MVTLHIDIRYRMHYTMYVIKKAAANRSCNLRFACTGALTTRTAAALHRRIIIPFFAPIGNILSVHWGCFSRAVKSAMQDRYLHSAFLTAKISTYCKRKEPIMIEKSLKNQYLDASNINARIHLHELYSTNKKGWFPWIFEQCPFKKAVSYTHLTLPTT